MKEEKTVLIVEDVAIMRKMISNYLKKIGIENILEAEDGLIALKMLKSNKIDAILLDIIMPNMDGIQLLKSIRNNDVLKDLPVIIISSDTSKKTKEKINALGVCDYINKPFTEEEIIAKLKKYL